MNQLIEPMLRPLTKWAQQSQRHACRNAMVASTALTAGRRERDEVEEFILVTLARRHHRSEDASAGLPVGRLG